jgi:hypothetical protein
VDNGFSSDDFRVPTLKGSLTKEFFVKKPLIFGGSVLLVLVAAGAWLIAAAPPAPTVPALMANPAYVVVNTPTQVLFTVQITDPNVQASGVNLLKVDAFGKTLSIVGVMRDDGANGDVQAGDKVFSSRTIVSGAIVGSLFYRVSAPFKGTLQRVLSPLAEIKLDPFQLPPDPGEAGKQTLEGIDLDNDGVRDDVQRYIGYQYPQPNALRASLNQYAAAFQALLIQEHGTNMVSYANELLASTRCVAAQSGPTEALRLTADIRAETLNTHDRSRAYIQLQRGFADVAISVPSLKQLSHNDCRS